MLILDLWLIIFNTRTMILPIVGYGHPVLRKVGEDITEEHPDLKQTIADMYETMYNAYGVGLAAPQIGKAIRLFIIDTTPFNKLTLLFKFTDKISSLKKRLIQKKLKNITEGKTFQDYRMRFIAKKGR